MSDACGATVSSLSRIALRVAVYVAIAKALGFAKEAYLASLVGTSVLADAYQVGLSLATWLGVTIASALSTIWVPLFVQAMHWHSERSAAFVRRSNWVALCLGVASALVTLLLASVVLAPPQSQTSASASEVVLRFAFWFVPLAMQTVLVGYLVARLMATQSHTYALAEAVPAVALMAVLFFATGSLESDLIAGTLLGAVAHLCVLLALLRARGIELRGVERPGGDDVLGKALLSFALLLPSQIAIGSTAPIDLLFAKSLGEGQVAVYGYALRLAALATGISAIALTRALLPALSDLVARADEKRALDLAKRWVAIMLLAGLLAAVALWFAAPVIVSLAFERGEFSASDTRAVASTLRILGLQMPLYFAGIVWVQWLAAHGMTRLIAGITIAQVVVKIAANALLVKWQGLEGIALGTVLMYAFALLLLWLAAMRCYRRAGNQHA